MWIEIKAARTIFSEKERVEEFKVVSMRKIPP